MKIKQANFLLSSPNLKLLPKSNLAEIALLGRSNAGKSSFINTLTNNKNLAKTSNTPGKTRLINLFKIEAEPKSFQIADLPGYGWAKVSKEMQQQWQVNLEEYLLKRENLCACAVFTDSRHGAQNNDIEMINWLKIHEIPYFIILAKCDYLKRNETEKIVKDMSLAQNVTVIPFSAKNRQYTDVALSELEKIVTNF